MASFYEHGNAVSPSFEAKLAKSPGPVVALVTESCDVGELEGLWMIGRIGTDCRLASDCYLALSARVQGEYRAQCRQGPTVMRQRLWRRTTSRAYIYGGPSNLFPGHLRHKHQLTEIEVPNRFLI
jgi:hypothetical protein